MNISSQPRVLIVDDNPFNRDMLKRTLEPEGITVEESRNGKEALERLKGSSGFLLIFMDLLMPGMDGFEAIQRIRSMGVTTPIIISSSMSSKEDRQRCLEAGGNDFLPKPIDINKIREIIKKYKADSFSPPKSSAVRPNSPTTANSQQPLYFADYHILLVEENDLIAERFYLFLKHSGFAVTRVPNGNKAWELFEANKYRFNIIISNVFTSGIDGMGILARIKRDYSKVLVFIYAEEYDADTFQLAIRLGGDGAVTYAEFEETIISLIESAIYQSKQKGSRAQEASTASQVRKAQANLIKYGCPVSCGSIDIAYSSLSDAGGDIACCRRFNLAGRCGILLGDVAGHSVMSSYISAFSLGILTSNWDKNQNPIDLLKTINVELNKSDYAQSHLCATALLWDRYRRKVKIATAGNPGGLIVRKKEDGSLDFQEPDGGGMCLGLLKEDHLFLNDEIMLEYGDYLFLFSDGIQKEYITDALSSGKIALKRKDIHGLCQEIIDRILEKQGQNDDMILIAVEQNKKFREHGLHYEFPSTYHDANESFKWLDKQNLYQKISMGKDIYWRISLALREALINAVKHGNRFNPEASVHLSLYVKPGELRIDVSDEGSGFDLSDKMKRIEDVHILQSGGRGLAVMNSISDEIKVNGGTVSLIFREKEFKPEEMNENQKRE